MSNTRRTSKTGPHISGHCKFRIEWQYIIAFDLHFKTGIFSCGLSECRKIDVVNFNPSTSSQILTACPLNGPNFYGFWNFGIQIRTDLQVFTIRFCTVHVFTFHVFMRFLYYSVYFSIDHILFDYYIDVYTFWTMGFYSWKKKLVFNFFVKISRSCPI